MRKKRVSLLLVLQLGLASRGWAQEHSWTTKPPMPTATSLHSASVVNGKIYVVGGTDTIYRVATDYFSTVRMYDPIADTWTMKADMPRGRARAATCVVDGKIYAIGGSPHGDADFAFVEMYDPVTDTWTRKADLPRARCFLSANAVGGKIHVIGGKTYPSATMVSTVEEYDPATDTWARKPGMPTVRGQHSACVMDGKIYVIGGIASNYGPVLSTVDVYDPATDTWTRKADMPTARFFLSTSVVGGRIYAIGGGNSWGPALATVEAYDPATDSWSKEADMPTARATHSACVVDGTIYTIGGTLGIEPWVPSAAVEVFMPQAPPPDFNHDFVIDIQDLIILIEHWGQDYPRCDIALWPLSDGTVDALDLEVLMGYWGQEIYDPTLVAHWTFDEAEGLVASDAAGENHAAVIGNAIWRPDDGVVAGALEFDGATCVLTDSVLNPNAGPLSVFTWIKGGGPSQVFVSQAGGANWLLTDAAGVLMTDLKDVTTRSPKALQSQVTITDGDWHRVALVWDGANRSLSVDGMVVATDTQSDLPDCDGGLYLGCGKEADPGTFFSGMIDDVRVYDRAVGP